MAKIAVMLADGFEEVEGLTTVDLCRRAGIEVTMVSINGTTDVMGSHKIGIKADKVFEDVDFNDIDMIILPGGMPGTLNLGNHAGLAEKLLEFSKTKKVGAICAAPSVLAKLGILNGKTACCYPGFESDVANFTTNKVEVCDNVITSRGVGTAIEFALAIITMLVDANVAKDISDGIIY